MIVAVAASAFAWFTYKLNSSQSVPLLTLKYVGGRTTVENVGKGPAMNASFAGDDGRVITFLGTIAAGGSVQLSVTPRFDLHQNYRLYWHDVRQGLLGRRIWYRSVLHTQSFDHERADPSASGN